MKALILDNPGGRVTNSRGIPEKFASMIDALAVGGILAGYFNPSNKSELLQVLKDNPSDLVFSSTFGILDEHGEISAIHEILDDLGLTYIGSDAEALRLALDKPLLKTEWEKHRVNTPAWVFLDHRDLNNETPEKKLDALSFFPYIVKPANSGNSRGIDTTSVVENVKELKERVNDISLEFGSVLVEEYLGAAEDFQEITVGWIGNESSVMIMPAEIIVQLERKYPVISTLDKDAHLTWVQQLEDDSQWGQVVDFSRQAFSVISVRDYARLDIIRSQGSYHAIEINGQPTIPDRWFEACASGAGLNPTQYINAIFLSGIVRAIADGNKKMFIPPEMYEIIPLKVITFLLSAL